MSLMSRLRAVFNRRPPTPPPKPAPQRVNLAATAASRVRARLPNQRTSQEPMTLAGLLGWYEDRLDGYPADSRSRISRVLRALADSDEDVQGTLRDLRSLCGAGFSLDFQGSKASIKAAQKEMDSFLSRLYPEGGGLAGLIANQVGEIALTGASSLEWYPERSRRGVAGVAVVPAEEVRIRRDDLTGELIHEQHGMFGGQVTLHPRTYAYTAAVTHGRNPHGVPLFVASLAALERKRQLLDAEQRVINLMARSALVKASVPKPKPEELGLLSANDPLYVDALAAYYGEVADLIVASSENGLYVGPNGVEIDVVPVTQTAGGAAEITRGNQHRVWNGLGTLPFLRGEMDSTTQALSQVTIPIVHAQAVMVQQTLARALEFGLNLHLQLRGIPAQVFVLFTPPKSPFLLDEATALLRKAEAHTKLAALFGPAWAQAAMREFDVVEGDAARAPAWWNPGGATTPPDTGDTP